MVIIIVQVMDEVRSRLVFKPKILDMAKVPPHYSTKWPRMAKLESFFKPKANQSFPTALLDYQVQAGDVFLLSTIWAWSCPSHRKDMVCIWPNNTRAKEAGSNTMLQGINDANAKMAAPLDA